jgi:Ca2+-transporting ATPase
MILTDDDFSTIVRAVRLGRSIYDNLQRYIRFQMAGLFGFIATFLGSSIFWIAGGLPFLPAQTIFINFSVQVSQAFGLGFGQPRPGLMERPPRPSGVPILGPRMLAWLALAGIYIGAGTLLAIQLGSGELGDWGNGVLNEDVGRTMGLVAFAFFNIAISISTKDETRSVLGNLESLGDRNFVIATVVSVLITVGMAELGMLQRLLGTVSLSSGQWIVAFLIGMSLLVVAEVRKALWKIPVDEVPREG